MLVSQQANLFFTASGWRGFWWLGRINLPGAVDG
jgi:hypothetical protein